jgi:tRNA pseudouridine55 synthase
LADRTELDGIHAGFINLDKPSGPTSHDMVALVWGALGIRQVGHTGTLDPLASGVLVIGFGPATRLISYLADQPKEYIAGLRLGTATSTQDITGEVSARVSTTGVSEADIHRAVDRFRGDILQIPPMVSALKRDGKRLYDLARQGQTVERNPRPVHVYELEVLMFTPGDPATAVLRVRCSGGFYVRTLCADIGDVLGCGGCMESLRRAAVGRFVIQEAQAIEAVQDPARRRVISPSTGLSHLPRVCISEAEEARVVHGMAIVRADTDGGPGSVRLENDAGQLVAMARKLQTGEGWQYQPCVVLRQAAPAGAHDGKDGNG